MSKKRIRPGRRSGTPATHKSRDTIALEQALEEAANARAAEDAEFNPVAAAVAIPLKPSRRPNSHRG